LTPAESASAVERLASAVGVLDLVDVSKSSARCGSLIIILVPIGGGAYEARVLKEAVVNASNVIFVVLGRPVRVGDGAFSVTTVTLPTEAHVNAPHESPMVGLALLLVMPAALIAGLMCKPKQPVKPVKELWLL